MTPTTGDTQGTSRALYVVVALLLLLLFVLLRMLVTALGSGGEVTGYDSIGGLRALHVIAGPGVGDKPLFDAPMGAAFGLGGRIYVADTGNNRVVVFDEAGAYLFQFGGLGVAKPAPGGRASWEPGRLNYPTDVAVDARGNVYVADFRNDQIQVFDAEGKFMRVFPDRMKPVGRGASGQGGTGIAVTSLAIDRGRVYATDAYQIVVFDTNGKAVDQFGRPGTGPTDLDHPNGIAVGPKSTLVVSDSNNNRVVGLTAAGSPLWTLGERVRSVLPTSGSDPRGSLAYFEVPRGLTAARGGDLIVADAIASQLVRVSSTGKLVATYGRRGTAPGELYFPTDIDASGEKLLVAEKGGNRVQVLVVDEN